ncbi:MAG: hypothetical protein ACJ0SL_09030 [Candidatus Rariloculaceae bacterium]
MTERKPRRWVVIAYIVLLALVIPWYWPAGDTRQAFGFPLWALVSLAAVFATSTLTAYIYLSGIDEDPNG